MRIELNWTVDEYLKVSVVKGHGNVDTLGHVLAHMCKYVYIHKYIYTHSYVFWYISIGISSGIATYARLQIFMRIFINIYRYQLWKGTGMMLTLLAMFFQDNAEKVRACCAACFIKFVRYCNILQHSATHYNTVLLRQCREGESGVHSILVCCRVF